MATKCETYVEYNGIQVLTSDLEKEFKRIWKESGKTIKDLKDIKLYYNALESTCYYVVNGTENGKFTI